MNAHQASPARALAWASTVAPALLLLGTTSIALVAVPRAAPGHEREILASAVTLDLLLVWPLAVAWFWVRTRRVPWLALLPAFVVGHVAASLALPAEQQGLLERARWLAVPVELALVGTLVVLARRGWREAGAQASDFVSRFRVAATRVLGVRLAADVLTTEVALLVHAFAPPRRVEDTSGLRFTTHREVGYGAVLVGVAMLLVVETLAVHALASAWSATLAWVLTGVGVYAGVWLLGDWRALRARPIVVGPEVLGLRLGLRWEACVPRAWIAGCERLPRRRGPRPDDVRVLGLLGEPNVELRLTRPVELVGAYGLRRTTARLWLRVDEAERFVAALEARSPDSGE